MKYVYDYLQKKGYNVNKEYYEKIKLWIELWRGNAEWLTSVKTIDNKTYPMYTLNMAKRSCEDLASIVTSEPFEIKAKANDEILQKDIKESKLIEKLDSAIETMACSGTVGTIARIVNAEEVGEEETFLRKGTKTKVKTINISGEQIIPLLIEDGEIIDCAFVSEQKQFINNKPVKIYYLEIHKLEEKGYQITNVYLNGENGEEIEKDGVVKTYNTLSHVPLFSLCKLPKVNPIKNNNGLGMAIYANAIDQLKLIDLTYNNFGQDFRLGQKVMIINKKLTRIQTEEYRDKDGNIKNRQKIIYPTDIQKQQFVDISDSVTGTGKENPYVFEYNPDLRVGDNKEGTQFSLDTFSFELGYGTHFYSFERGNVVTATETILSRTDFVDNMQKVRKSVSEYLKNACKSLLLCEKILGNASIDENQEIEIPEADGFLQDDETRKEKLKEDWSAGAISTTKYLMEAYNMTEEEAKKEIKRKKEEEEINVTIEDKGE